MAQAAQKRFTPQELSLIRNTFKDKPELLKLVRKVMLPEIDTDAPLGQVIDMSLIEANEVKGLDLERAYVHLLARSLQINMMENGLMQLSILAEEKQETEAEEIARRKKDSLK